ncbi:APC family permease [Fructilactobacillus fructivorans]|uniref:Amino acid permease n=1 Tax=Fructilactobacillus fructivorans TaxID=1614 RepID=A0A0C1PN53_9LACO|nr:amino acid permease [Fructilactobacillus fructivorans]KID41351.1 Amino acid permease [Fructilactobacillus fructivorans]MCT0151763.1 amino acid permease [Fructilactobacillus fructivorans]MCT2867109.1 amino acid permease [Fructilactobacillus fructivorans]MCT2868331.1 amino acid permease [Fructilactobacillus fructivorans]MCT2873039.1 amino acid permease [Fructilactobacillus fructivorans]
MPQSNLKKNIGIGAALSTVMGTVIGAGVFFKTASVVANTHSVTLTILAWIIGGLLTICGGLTVSELAAAIPKTGGTIQYLKYTYGPLTGFLLGWAEMLVYFPANLAALSIVFSTQLINLFHLSASLSITIAIICALSITVINLLGSKIAGSVQSLTLIVKLIPIFIIVIAGLLLPGHVDVSFWPPMPSNGSGNLLTAFGGGLLATMFAYDGWINIGSIAGEMKNPQKDLPKAIILGLTFIMIIYVLVNWVFLKNMPLNQIAGNQNTAYEVAMKLFGGIGGKLVTIGILISVYGAMNGYILTGIRVPYAMAKDDQLPFSKYFARLSKHTAAPYVSGLFMFAVAVVMIFMGSFDMLTDMLVFVMWIFNCLLFVALFILRKREPELVRPYKVPWYPVVPIIALVGGVFILISTILTQTTLAIIGIIATLIGIPIYYGHKMMKKTSTEK